MLVPVRFDLLGRRAWMPPAFGGGNLESEFAIVDDFPFVAMDTEFPGVAIRPLGDFKRHADNKHHALRANVDLRHLSSSVSPSPTPPGLLPSSASGRRDISNPDSVDLLKKPGINFARNRERGVDAERGPELLMSPGVVLNDDVSWVTFHCAYDFGNLLEVLQCPWGLDKLAEQLDGDRVGICHQGAF